MTLKVVHTINDVNRNPSQFHIAITEINKDDTAMIASKFDGSIHVAVYGFAAKDGSFEFEDNDQPILKQVKNQLLKRPQVLRRLLKVGVFDDD